MIARIAVQVPTTFVSTAALSNDTNVGGDFVTSMAAQTISGTLSASLVSGESVEVSYNGGIDWIAATTQGVGGSTWTVTGTLLPGTNTIEARVINADGPGTAFSRTYTLDTDAPVGLALSNKVAASSTYVIGTLTSSDSSSVTYGTSFDFSGNDFHNSYFNIVGDQLVSNGYTLTSGIYRVRLAAIDLAGNVSYLAELITIANPLTVVAFGRTGGASIKAPASATSVSYTINFSEAVSGVDASDFTLHTTGTAIGTIASVSQYSVPNIYVVTVNAVSGDGELRLDLNGSNTGIKTAFNVSMVGGVTQGPSYDIDHIALAPPKPAMTSDSDTGVSDSDAITRSTSPVLTGTAERNAVVKIYDGKIEIGTFNASDLGIWWGSNLGLAEGSHTLTASQTDWAGNVSPASMALTVVIDRTAPTGLALSNDRIGTVTALPSVTIGTLAAGDSTALTYALASGNGINDKDNIKFQLVGNLLNIGGARLGAGTYNIYLSATDAAGNVAYLSRSITVADAPVDTPSVTPTSSNVDGVLVLQQPVTLPGGGTGTQTTIGMVATGRIDTGGAANAADVPLAISNGNTLLLAQLPPGYGLTASSGSTQTPAASTLRLTEAILAATSDQTTGEKAQLTGEVVRFVSQLTSGVSLLVGGVTPVSTRTPDGPLTITGTSNDGQHTALVIDARGLATGSTLVLNAVDFAAIVGSANVTGNTRGQMLSGDAASQQFFIAADSNSKIFAGDGNDRMTVNATTAPVNQAITGPTATPQAVTTNLLHGGRGDDVAAFSGASTDYNIALHRGYAVVSSKAQPGQQSMVINVESLSFANTTIQIDNAVSLTALAGLYQKVLGRQADPLGIEFWADSVANGTSLGKITLQLIGSTEAQSRKVALFDGNNSHDIELLYQTIFNRAADTEGLSFWTNAMTQGMSLADVARHFVEAPEMQLSKIGAQDWSFQMA